MLELIKKINLDFDFETELGKYCDEVCVTPSGSVIGTMYGTDRDAESTMVATHTDLPCFVCSEIESDGKVSVFSVGGITAGAAAWGEAVSERGVRGIFVTCGGDASAKCKVDIGCDGRTAARRVRVGDRFYPYRPVKKLTGKKIVGFGLQVSAPCAAVLDCAEMLSKVRPTGNVYFAYTSQGQFDCKQYSSAADAVGADRAVCVGFCDTEASHVKLGGGAVARLCDKSFSSDKTLSDRLVECGAKPTVLSVGSCPASRVQLGGVPSAQVDIPLNYAGTPAECADVSDIKSVSDILTKLL